jgi:hypothetical protein
VVPTVPSAQDYPRGVAWVDGSTVAYTLFWRDADGRGSLSVHCYDLSTHALREVIPPGQLEARGTYVQLTPGARYGLWRSAVPQDDGGNRVADLRSGQLLPLLHFPEKASATLSPDGGRVMAAATDSDNLYLARLSANGTSWEVKQFQAR